MSRCRVCLNRSQWHPAKMSAQSLTVLTYDFGTIRVKMTLKVERVELVSSGSYKRDEWKTAIGAQCMDTKHI